MIYSCLNALGLLVLAVTGIFMWFQLRRRHDRAKHTGGIN